MTDEEFIKAVLSSMGSEYRGEILQDLKKDEPESAIYGWNVYLPIKTSDIWKQLTLRERVVAFLGCERAEDVSDRE